MADSSTGTLRKIGYDLSMSQVPLRFLNDVVVGDACEILREVPSGLIQCVVTSPPYFGHRVYSNGSDPREIGREQDVAKYITHLCKVFDKVYRVLRDDGTLWLNLGDTYRDGRLLGVPWRTAIALQDAGWILRSDIIWHKPNAMPSSVKSRPTTDHEYVFLFSKTNDYYYDADAIREPHVTFSPESKMRGGRGHFGLRNGTPEAGKNSGNSNLHDARWDQAFHPAGRNKRTVWSIPLGKSRDSHFAVFPESLVEPCVKAGSSEGSIVLDPFTGSGTTGAVSRRLRREFIGCELVEEYAQIAKLRINAAESRPTLFDDPEPIPVLLQAGLLPNREKTLADAAFELCHKEESVTGIIGVDIDRNASAATSAAPPPAP